MGTNAKRTAIGQLFETFYALNPCSAIFERGGVRTDPARAFVRYSSTTATAGYNETAVTATRELIVELEPETFAPRRGDTVLLEEANVTREWKVLADTDEPSVEFWSGQVGYYKIRLTEVKR